MGVIKLEDEPWGEMAAGRKLVFIGQQVFLVVFVLVMFFVAYIGFRILTP